MNGSHLLLFVTGGTAIGTIIGLLKTSILIGNDSPLTYSVLGGILGTIAFVISFFAKSL